VTKTIAVVYITHNTKDVPTVWKGPDWESFFIRFFNAKANFTVINDTLPTP
jgi:hypothetical protein